jgi:hypothetical protein
MSILTIIKNITVGIIPVSCVYAFVNVPVICIHLIPTKFYNQQNLSSIKEPIPLSRKNNIAFKKIYLWRGLIKYFHPMIVINSVDYQASLLTATPNYNIVLNVYSKNFDIYPNYSLHITYDKDTNKTINKYTYST